MSHSIIGNQEQRKSRINTEKWKEHKEYYSNPENFKVKTEEQKKTSPIENPSLEKILKYNSDGKPIITLSPFERTVVRVFTRKDYDTLMQVYESAGWLCNKDIIPTTLDCFTESTKDLCITARNQFDPGSKSSFFKLEDFCSTTVFYSLQNITPEMITELNEWYDTNKPIRASKGK